MGECGMPFRWLDVCIARGEGKVDTAVVSQAAGLTGSRYLFDIATSVLCGDVGGALSHLEQLSQRSVEFDRLAQQLISHYRNLMIARTVRKPEEMIVCLPEELEQFTQQAQKYRLSTILFAIDTLSQALGKMSQGSSKRTELEMALVRLCNPSLDGQSGRYPEPVGGAGKCGAFGYTAFCALWAACLHRFYTTPVHLQCFPGCGCNGGGSATAKKEIEQPITEETLVEPAIKELEKVLLLECWPEVLERVVRHQSAAQGDTGRFVGVCHRRSVFDRRAQQNVFRTDSPKQLCQDFYSGGASAADRAKVSFGSLPS